MILLTMQTEIPEHFCVEALRAGHSPRLHFESVPNHLFSLDFRRSPSMFHESSRCGEPCSSPARAPPATLSQAMRWAALTNQLKRRAVSPRFP